MPHDARKLLEDMRLAMADAQSFLGNAGLDEYLANKMLRSAVERQLSILGEAMNRLLKADPVLAQSIPDSRKIVDFRNILIHGYDVVDDVLVWGILENHLAPCNAQVIALLAQLDTTPPSFPEG